MSDRGNSGCGCLIAVGLVFFIIKACSGPAVDAVDAYGKKISGEHGGLWAIPLFLLGFYIWIKIKEK